MAVGNSREDYEQRIAAINARYVLVDGANTSLRQQLTKLAEDLTALDDLKFPEVDAPDTAILRINCGGPAVGDWDADRDYLAGSTGAMSLAFVSRTTSDAPELEVLRTYRVNHGGYQFTAPAGRIRIEQWFAEPSAAVAGRVQDLTDNGSLYFDDLDVVAAAGAPGRSLKRTTIIDHAGGVVTAAQTASAGQTLLNAIAVFDATGETVSTPAASAPTVGSSDWLTYWYNSAEITGTPALVERIATAGLTFDFGTGAPRVGIQADNFSMRAKRLITFTAHDWTFRFGALDDGGRLWIDGVNVWESWIQQAPTDYEHTQAMTAGVHEIWVDYNDVLYTGSLHFSYALAADPAPDPDPTPSGTVKHGSFQGSAFSSLQLLPQFEGLTQHTATSVHTFIDTHDTGAISNCLSWLAGRPGIDFLLAINVLQGEPGNFGSAAERNRCAAIAQQIQNAGLASRITIRHMYEYNAPYGFEWQWRSHGDSAGAAQLYNDIYDRMKAIAPGLRFVWNCVPWDGYDNDMTTGRPSLSKFDHMGLDVYNSDASGTQAQRWVTVGNRINNGILYSRAINKDWSMDEWANRAPQYQQGGGDDQTYIANVHTLCRTDGRCVSEHYFNSSDGGVGITLADTPNSLAAFKTSLDAY